MKEKVIKPMIVLIVGVVMTQCLVLSYNPIAAGYFAAAFAAGTGPFKYLIFPAMLGGTYFSMDLFGMIKYGLIMAVIMICTGLYERKGRKITATASGIICGADILVMEAGDTLLNGAVIGIRMAVIDFMLGVLAFSLAILFNYGIKAFYRPAAVSHIRNEEMVCIGTLLGIFAYFLCILNELPVSSIGIFIYFCILFGGYKYGAGMGAVTGAACGLVMSLAENNPQLMGVMCALGILAGAFRELGRLGSSIAFLSGVAALQVYFDFGMSEISNIESVCASVIVFLILPGRLVIRSARVVGEENSGILQAPLQNSEKINNIAKSLELLAASIEQGDVRLPNDPGVYTEEMTWLDSIWRGRMMDSRTAVAAQLQEMSGIISDFARQTYNIVSFEERQEEFLRKKFKYKKIILKRIRVYENSEGRYEATATLRVEKKKNFDKKVAELLISDFLGRDMIAASEYADASKEYKDLKFVERANFLVTYGAAKRARADVKVSGDNFGFINGPAGQAVMSISDGMGSGTDAYNDSETVIELLEQMLESGVREESAVKLINTVMMLNKDAAAPATIDIGIIDLYSGVCSFVKSGAACTFIKRGSWVECIRSTTMPVGVLHNVDMETASKKLYDGDIIIMISDGVVEAVPKKDRETELSLLLMDIDEDNPQAFADKIMNKVTEWSGQQPQDDMTVLVAAVWDNT